MPAPKKNTPPVAAAKDEQQQPNSNHNPATSNPAGPQTGGQFIDLRKRALSAVLLTLLLAIFVWQGEIGIRLTALAVQMILLWEWIRAWYPENIGQQEKRILQMAGGLAMLTAIFSLVNSLGLPDLVGKIFAPISALTLITILSIAGAGLLKTAKLRGSEKRFWFFVGLIFINYFALFIPGFFVAPFQQTALFAGDAAQIATNVSRNWLINPELPVIGLFILSIVIAVDIGGYCGGRLFGGPKLFPTISPGKTWTGLFGSLIFAIVISILWRLDPPAAFNKVIFSPTPGLNLGVLALAAIGGDLLQSKLKRSADIKDSSKLIPGHGGLFDRIDGLMAAILAAQLLGLFHAQG